MWVRFLRGIGWALLLAACGDDGVANTSGSTADGTTSAMSDAAGTSTGSADDLRL